MDKCCPDFPECKFQFKKIKSEAHYVCVSCGSDVSRTVLDMFLRDPWGTIKLKMPKKKEAS